MTRAGCIRRMIQIIEEEALNNKSRAVISFKNKIAARIRAEFDLEEPVPEECKTGTIKLGQDLQPLIDEVRRSEKLSAKDLAVIINARDGD